MWISRKQYNKLKEEIKGWEEWSKKINFHNGMREEELKIANEKILAQTAVINRIENELAKYKQMYADEVNKRLELIKLYEEKA